MMSVGFMSMMVIMVMGMVVVMRWVCAVLISTRWGMTVVMMVVIIEFVVFVRSFQQIAMFV
jgi:hypothetical protein